VRRQHLAAPAGATELGTKVEIKNLNSFRNVQRALEYETSRQAEELQAGRPSPRRRGSSTPIAA